jgi:hypothetical protein
MAVLAVGFLAAIVTDAGCIAGVGEALAIIGMSTAEAGSDDGTTRG